MSKRYTTGHGAKVDSARAISEFLGSKNWNKDKVTEYIRISEKLNPKILQEMKNMPNSGLDR